MSELEIRVLLLEKMLKDVYDSYVRNQGTDNEFIVMKSSDKVEDAPEFLAIKNYFK